MTDEDKQEAIWKRPESEIRALQSMMKLNGWKQIDIAKKLGISQSTVSNAITLSTAGGRISPQMEELVLDVIKRKKEKK